MWFWSIVMCVDDDDSVIPHIAGILQISNKTHPATNL